MSGIYESEIHGFVEGYFHAIGASIEERKKEFFVVLFPDGHRERFTYLPRIAGENKEIKLLAKGSRYLKAIIQECSTRGAYSEVNAAYTEESVRLALQARGCCDLCPFFTICERRDACCDFCHCFKNCNTRIENADFVRLEGVHSSEQLDIIGFVFSVELSNDYSLSQKIEKIITVLIDIRTGNILDNILIRDIQILHMQAPEENTGISEEMYLKFLAAARHAASDMVKKQLEVFKREIETPISEKITSIIGKYEEEYTGNYTKYTLEQLEQLQNEGLKLCEREIRGYTINSGYHLKNATLIHTSRDVREAVFRLHDSGCEIVLPVEIFLSRIDIRCTECGAEVDAGVLCEDGHVLCRNCRESCAVCHKIICDTCDHENYICSTCGEVVCPDCTVKCSSCGSRVCTFHSYTCTACGDVFCIDCYEICNVCGSNVCNHHMSRCRQCNEPACPEHIHRCGICHESFCEDHIEKCAMCNELLCEEHRHISAFSSRAVCPVHKATCAVCGDTFVKDEIKHCTTCGDELCPSHFKACGRCGKTYCSRHISHCRGCGNEVCECTPFVKCRFCGEEFCSDCINEQGYCRACAELTTVNPEVPEVKMLLQRAPGLAKYKKIYMGRSEEIVVLYGRSLFHNLIVVAGRKGDILGNREMSFLEDMKRKNRIVKKGRDHHEDVNNA